MLEHARCLTREEVADLVARARQMRSEYIRALIASAARRVKQSFSEVTDRRITGAQRFYLDVG